MKTEKLLEIIEDISVKLKLTDIEKFEINKNKIKLCYLNGKEQICLELDEENLKCKDTYSDCWYCNNLCIAKESCKEESINLRKEGEVTI